MITLVPPSHNCIFFKNRMKMEGIVDIYFLPRRPPVAGGLPDRVQTSIRVRVSAVIQLGKIAIEKRKIREEKGDTWLVREK